jgi:hypothetical protein
MRSNCTDYGDAEVIRIRSGTKNFWLSSGDRVLVQQPSEAIDSLDLRRFVQLRG